MDDSNSSKRSTMARDMLTDSINDIKIQSKDASGNNILTLPALLCLFGVDLGRTVLVQVAATKGLNTMEAIPVRHQLLVG
jgi:hypothetical protein